uniref:DJ-1/PfpI domain-containing protein n=1 Tax=Populus alba TaxID=43335 RepID=A0A4V6A7Q6_POPAL|nr:hypothetical protein D5086_0000188040 [Populus alba]
MILQQESLVLFITIFTIFIAATSSPTRAHKSNSSACESSCGTGKSAKVVPYPFGFSRGCPIILQCDHTVGDVKIGEFQVLNITPNVIVTNILADLNRSIERIKPLFGKNFGPSSNNSLLLQNCTKPLNSCVIPTSSLRRDLKLANCGDKNYDFNCYSQGRRAFDTLRYDNMTLTRCKSTYTEKPGHNFSLNATFDEVDFSKYDALVIPGGRAPEYLAINESVLNCARQFSDSGKVIAAICHGQLILAAAGLLKGRKCTAYHALRPVLIDAGAHWIEPKTMMDCVSDGNLITGVIYKAHPEYIQLVVKALGGEIAGSDKRILFLCGDFMEDYEVTVPLQSLQALGCHVDAVCPKKKAGDFCPTAVHDFEGDQTYTEKPGHNFILTASYEGLDASSYDALVIPGGRSPEYLALDETVIALVKKFMQSKKPVASICHGQQILAAAGVLKGRKCTAYPAVKLNVLLGGATWLEPDPIDRCYTDENLVTGAAWPGHPQFVSQLMALLGIRVSF